MKNKIPIDHYPYIIMVYPKNKHKKEISLIKTNKEPINP